MTIGIAELDGAAKQVGNAFDTLHGGLGSAPKFPQPMILEFLWRAGLRSHDPLFFQTVEHTLVHMCEGGIYDHLGGGFSRYSVDEKWLVPHFEKMLYDNAQLLPLLALAWRHSGTELFAERARETVGWLSREMVTGEGAFAASLDADSEGEEGKFYVWSLEEIEAVLGPDAADFAAQYDVTPGGNFEGHNILNKLKHLPRSMKEGWEAAFAAEDAPDAAARFSMLRGKLLKERDKRIRPGLDDKVLADWNGLMIAGLVEAGILLGEPSWLEMARRAFEFVAAHMSRDGRLGHSWRQGQLLLPGLASDYAAMIRAALALYEVTGEGGFLERALAWQGQLDAHYADPRDRRLFPHRRRRRRPGGAAARDRRRRHPQCQSAGGRQPGAARRAHRRPPVAGKGRPADRGHHLGAATQSVRPRLIAQRARPAPARRRDRLHRPACGSLRAGRVEIALPRPHRAARAVRRRAAADAPGAGEAESPQGSAAFVCVGETCSLPVTEPDKIAEAVAAMRPQPNLLILPR